MIEFKEVSLAFKGKTIFHDFTIKIPAGANISIRGESGKGKSSLLKLVQGYFTPDSGQIIIDDEVINEKSIHHLRKKMAWVPQNINLPVNSGEELVKLMEIEKNKETINLYMERLGLDVDILYKDFSRISGGQKQRIVISIVLSLGKPIILMDEPTSSLDEKSIISMIEVMRSLHDTTILSASHNRIWLDHSDKVIEL